VKRVCPFPAGGTSDILARMITAPLSKAIGQQLIVKNIGGAADTIGTLKAAQSPPDGYTIVQTGVGQDAVAHGAGPEARLRLDERLHRYRAGARRAERAGGASGATLERTFGELLACRRKNPGKPKPQ
jgi:hypothetical protein